MYSKRNKKNIDYIVLIFIFFFLLIFKIINNNLKLTVVLQY